MNRLDGEAMGDDLKLTSKRKQMILTAIVHEIRGLKATKLTALRVPEEAAKRVEDYIWNVAKWLDDNHPDAE